MFCLVIAKETLQRSSRKQFASSFSVPDGISRPCFFRVVDTITLRNRTVNSFAFFGLLIMFLVSLGFWTFIVLFRIIAIIYFAITTMTSFFRAVFIKIRKRFDLFAFRTSLRYEYDCFRHFGLLCCNSFGLDFN